MSVNQNGPEKPYPAEKARQGQIVLRKPWQKIVFFGGLAAAAIFAAVGGSFGLW